jgi:beta-glucosidase
MPIPYTKGIGTREFRRLLAMRYRPFLPRSRRCSLDHLTCKESASRKLVEHRTDLSFGVNHYSTRWATGKVLDSADPYIACFGNVEHVTERDGKPIGTRGHNGHPYNVPWGFYALLKHIDKTWAQAEANCLGRQLPILVTENGYAAQDEKGRSMKEIINDVERIDYFAGYLASLVRAKKEGTPIIGYMAWSLME